MSIHEALRAVTVGCVFCRIVARESPADIEYEDDQVLAFKDLYPKAPVHLLVIPKRHIDRSRSSSPVTRPSWTLCSRGETSGGARRLWRRGYRLSCNTGPEGGQVVYHTHFHFTAGRRA